MSIVGTTTEIRPFSVDFPEEKLADARVILSQQWTIPPENDPAELDDGWAGLESDAPFERRRRIMKAVIWLMVLPPIAGFVLGMLLLVAMCVRGLMSFLGL